MQFNFDNAFMHFARTGAPRGFVWRYALAYVGLTILMGVVMMTLMGEWYINLFQAYGSQDPDQIIQASQISGGVMALIYFVIMPISLFFYAVFEAAYLRRYMRQDRFFLRIGPDEFRVFTVLLCWFLFFIAATIALAILSMLIMIPLILLMGGDNPEDVSGIAFIFGLIVPFLMFIPLGLLAIRFSPAAAMTIRDKRVRFLSAWRATKGKFGVLLGAYAAWFVLGLVGYIVATGIMFGVGAATMGVAAEGDDSPFAMMRAMGPVTIILYLAMTAAGACFYYIWAGPAALIARTDPDADAAQMRPEHW